MNERDGMPSGPPTARGHVGRRSSRPGGTMTTDPGAWGPIVRRAPKSKPKTKPKMQTLRGIAVSPGVAVGPAMVLDPHGLPLPNRRIAAADVPAELDRLDRGLAAAREEAGGAEADARHRLGPQYADILAAHARMIEDPALRREARLQVERQRLTAESALSGVLDGYAARLEGLANRYLAARAADVRDIQQRILRQFAEQGGTAVPCVPDEPAVLLAHDLTPSQTAGLDPARALGFATEAGGRTSHTAIVAAGLEIPAVVGLGRFLDLARTCQMVIVDGDEGLVILDPDPQTLERYRRAAAERNARFAGLAGLASLPAETLDGVRVGLWGNIEFPGEVAACRERGADGIGLYRTEFLYLNADRPPTEQEQFTAYEAVVRSMGSRPVIIRTLDLGADKLVSYQTSEGGERNPFLGLRSLRLSLRDPVLFRTQLRAILRASALGDVRIMFPLVSTLGEFRRARAVLDDVAAELAAEGVPVREDLPVGVMIEVPAAALMAEELAREVDFFSIGTNDLIQYTLAVDRTNETVADLYSAADPAVLRLLAMVVKAAQPCGIEVNVCGTMGGDPLYTMLLLGLGLRQLSMPPHQLPEVKRVIRGIRLDQARAVAEASLREDTAEGVVAHLHEALNGALPDTPAVPTRDRGR
jgi:phosphotransferase system enzyme I (PtsI)